MAIPEALREIPQWVCAKNGSKCPFRAYEPEAASSSNPDTWGTYDEAEAAVRMGHYDNVGFVFHNNGIVGIDIDTGFDEDGLLSREAADILSQCASYTERSRSGRGFHILLRGFLPFDGKNNHKGIEIYQNGRYFILTGDTVAYPEEIVENQDAIDYVVRTYFREEEKDGREGPVTERVYSPQWELPKGGRVKLRPVYPRIPSGSRNLFLTSLAGMLHNLGYSKKQIYDELLYANTVACDPCLDKREIKGIVNSVARYKR